MDKNDNQLQNKLPISDVETAETNPAKAPNCFFFKASVPPSWEEHPHRHFVILYVMHGSCEYLPDGQPEEQALSFSAGQYLLTDKPLGRSIRKADEIELLGCYFLPSLFFESLPAETSMSGLLHHPSLGFPATYPADELCRRTLTDSNGRVFKILENAMQAYEAKEICYLSLIRSFLTIALILTAHRTVSGISEAGRSRIVSYLCNYVQTNYARSISLSEICKTQYLNASFISRKFKETVGMTFEQYLQTTRMQNAKALLSSTDLSVEEISIRVGYTDTGSFRKIFKRICGISPTEFRRFHA